MGQGLEGKSENEVVLSHRQIRGGVFAKVLGEFIPAMAALSQENSVPIAWAENDQGLLYQKRLAPSSGRGAELLSPCTRCFASRSTESVSTFLNQCE